jgi:hypothetical protein
MLKGDIQIELFTSYRSIKRCSSWQDDKNRMAALSVRYVNSS